MEIPPGQDQLILLYNEDARGKYILKKCTKAEGVTDAPTTKSAFLAIYQATLRNAGYFCGTSIHAIQRYLGKRSTVRSLSLGPDRVSSCRMPVIAGSRCVVG